MPEQWKVLSSKYLSNNPPWGVFRKDHVQLPSGVEMPDYYVLEYPDWNNIIAIDKDENFVLIKQYRHGIQKTCFEIAAGVIDPGESPLESAKRELLEETGYVSDEWEPWMLANANPATHNNITHSFLARNVRRAGDQQLESTEDIEVVLLPAAEVKKLLLDNQIWQGLQSAALWKYFAV